MKFCNDLPREKVLSIYKFVIEKRNELNYGQRRLCRLVKERFNLDISENTISGWIFRKIMPFANEKTQFKAKPRPEKKELEELYIKHKQSAMKLGKKYDVSPIIVIHWIKDYGIKPRTHEESMNTYLIKKELAQKKLNMPNKEYLPLTPEKAYILGVLCGDAHINHRFVRLEIAHDRDFIEEFIECFRKVYGLDYKYTFYKPKNTLVSQINSQIICRDLLRYGNFRTENWNVPNEIMTTDNEKIIGSFLRGFYDSEGCSSSRCSITCSSINEKGLIQIADLLKRLGIESTLREQKNGKYYVLYIFRKERFKRFKERVGFTIQRKMDKLNETLNTGFFTKRSVADIKDIKWKE